MWESFADFVIRRISKRQPDFIIGGVENPYLIRWWVIPRNRFFNVYLHWFLRSDDDRALHDHPWINLSILLRGSYTEHRIEAGGIHKRHIRREGGLCARLSGKLAHRIELHSGACWTLFITGPVYRKWGFHCPERGWVLHSDFSAPWDSGSIGKGCDGGM